MLSQFISALFNSIMSRVVNTLHGWHHIKFYFISFLIFLFSVGFIYRDVVTMAVQNVVFNQIRFRDCRDIIGLQQEFTKILAKDTIVSNYSVYLYQPINNAFYKKSILTNSEAVMRSPALQGVYLKDQPTLNQQLQEHDYYLVDIREASKHSDLQYLIDISSGTRLFYALKVDNKVMGEISIEFKVTPSALEIEQTLKELSPLLYNYIL